MSLAKMISSDPDVRGNLNETLATAARHAMFCADICTSCADACSAEETDMRQCIRSCCDCADICDTTAKVSVRRTGQNGEVLTAMLETCARTCEICAEESERHDHEHCRLCAEMCREFDVIVASEVRYYMPFRRLLVVFKKIANAISPRGRFIALNHARQFSDAASTLAQVRVAASRNLGNPALSVQSGPWCANVFQAGSVRRTQVGRRVFSGGLD